MRDCTSGQRTPGVIKSIGLDNPLAVSLAMSKDVPAEVRTKIDDLRDKIVADQIDVATD